MKVRTRRQTHYEADPWEIGDVVKVEVSTQGPLRRVENHEITSAVFRSRCEKRFEYVWAQSMHPKARCKVPRVVPLKDIIKDD